MRLDQALRQTSLRTFGGTDCAQAIEYARTHKLEVDTFLVITDNETYGGRSHPHEALQRYRRETGIDAKLIVLATTASEFSIADPSDGGMLDIAGFDSAVPQLINEFSRGL
jgi:60 kDa SS-A/Ro ribonucleoprotein